MYEYARKIATTQGDDWANVSISDYPHLVEHSWIVVRNSSKQKDLSADQRAIQELNLLHTLLVIQELWFWLWYKKQ